MFTDFLHHQAFESQENEGGRDEAYFLKVASIAGLNGVVMHAGYVDQHACGEVSSYI